MPTKKITIAIVDDQSLFRLGLMHLMKDFDEIKVVFDAMHGLDLQEKLKNNEPISVVLMDISMPGMDGFATTKLSMDANENSISEMIKAGASGLLTTLKKDFHDPAISQKELAFLQLCSTDSTYREMAIKLNISHRTVDNYRESLFKKLTIKSRTGLVVYGIKNGLIKI